MLSTIEDLSNYAQIHLNNGTYQNTTILGEETLQLMHEPHFTTLPIKDNYNDGRKYGRLDYMAQRISSRC